MNNKSTMDEYEFKLNRGDPVLIANTVKALTERIVKFHKDGNKNEVKKHCTYLKEKCLSRNIAISMTALEGLIHICKYQETSSGIMDISKVLSEFLSSLVHVQNTSAIIELFCRALYCLDFDRYGIMFNQHPLITVIKKDQSAKTMILVKMEEFIANKKAPVMKIFKPFLLYVLYDHEKKIDELMQHEILDACGHLFDDDLHTRIILFTNVHLSRSLMYCLKGFEEKSYLVEPLILCIYEMMRNNEDVYHAVYRLLHYIMSLEHEHCFEVEVVFLVQCVNIAPMKILRHLLEILYLMVTHHLTNEKTLNIVKSSLVKLKLNLTPVEWISQDSFYFIDEILTFGPTKSKKRIGSDGVKERMIRFFDYRGFVMNEITSGTFDISHRNECPVEFLMLIFDHLLGVFYSGLPNDEITNSLDLLLKCCEKSPRLTTKVLPVLLYKLTVTTDETILLKLLHSLPKMGVLKENLPNIVKTIKLISMHSPTLQTVALSIFYELTCVDVHAFPFLQELLIKENPTNAKEDMLTKAYVLRELCRKNMAFEVYGTELTSYISKVLNAEKSEENTISQAWAFEALKHLYRHDVLDIGPAWNNLSPRYENDKRGKVIKSMCEMLAEISNENSAPSSKYLRLIDDVVKLLWKYTLDENEIIVTAAFNALSQFNADQILPFLPEYYSTSEKSAFGNITGSAWIQVLSNCTSVQLKPAIDMLKSLVTTEIRNYMKSVYDVSEGRREPTNMDYLPAYSIVAGLVSYIRRKVQFYMTNRNVLYLEILRLLSYKYDRPFPPMDWSFLCEVIHSKEARDYCLKIASHQVMLSGSARRIIETYMSALAERKHFDNDIVTIYTSLPYLCNSIQPLIVRPFIRNTLDILAPSTPLTAAAQENLKIVTNVIKKVLREQGLSEGNRDVIAQEITTKLGNLEYGSGAFEILIDAVPTLPMKYVNDLSNPTQFDSMDGKLLTRCLRIRTMAALNATDNPLGYLDAFIDSQLQDFNYDTIPFELFMEHFQPVFKKYQCDKHMIEWMTSLMVKIQLRLSERGFLAVFFPCSIFMAAVVVLSGFHVFVNNSDGIFWYNKYFPYALAFLVQIEGWSTITSQIAEWLYDLSNSPRGECGKGHDEMFLFSEALLTLRNEDAFNEKFKWMKYIETVDKF